MAENKISCPRGDTRIITLTVKDANGDALDLTSISTVYLSIKAAKEDSAYIVKKKEGAVEGDPILGIVAFEILPADLEEVAVGEWWYDIELTFNDGTKYTPIIDRFEVLADITRLTYTITASTGANGAINPTGAVSVESGADKVFTITPDAGYEVDTFLVDDVDASGDLVAQNGSWVYTHTAIADTTVAVAWKASA